MDKKLLRKELLAVRQEIAATRPEAAKELARNIVGWLEANPQFSSVGLYYPIQSEPDLMEALGAWQSEKPGRMLALPVVMKGKMGYYQWTPGVEMVESGFHIMVPKEKIPVVPQVLLAPCIGFSDIGCRLGYGAGWFDRTLSRSRCPMRPATRRGGSKRSLTTFCFSGSQPNGMSVRPRSSENQ